MLKKINAKFPSEIFRFSLNIPLIHQAVTGYMACIRQGNHKVKTRGEVVGSGRKPFKQKGTGRARQGSIRAPQMKGGGVVHGPTNLKNYTQKVPKKMKFISLLSALSNRYMLDVIYVLEQESLNSIVKEKPSTKVINLFLQKLINKNYCKKNLFIIENIDNNIALSLRNLLNVNLIKRKNLNTYNVIISDNIIFTENSYENFVKESLKKIKLMKIKNRN